VACKSFLMKLQREWGRKDINMASASKKKTPQKKTRKKASQKKTKAKGKSVSKTVPVIVDDKEKAMSAPLIGRSKKKGKGIVNYERRFPKISPKNIVEIRAILTAREEKNNPTKVKYSDEFVPMILAHMQNGGELKGFADLVRCSESTVHRWVTAHANFSDAVIDGQLYFIESLHEKLIDWMCDGHSFESFGGIIGRGRDWLYDLAKFDPVFASAKEIGTLKSMGMWENLLKAQVSGTLARLKTSTPIRNKNGDVQLDGSGNPITKKEYVPAMGSDRALMFAMRARFKEYRPEEGVDSNEQKGELDDAIAALDAEQKDGKK